MAGQPFSSPYTSARLSPVERHLGCFQFLAGMNKTANMYPLQLEGLLWLTSHMVSWAWFCLMQTTSLPKLLAHFAVLAARPLGSPACHAPRCAAVGVWARLACSDVVSLSPCWNLTVFVWWDGYSCLCLFLTSADFLVAFEEFLVSFRYQPSISCIRYFLPVFSLLLIFEVGSH